MTVTDRKCINILIVDDAPEVETLWKSTIFSHKKKYLDRGYEIVYTVANCYDYAINLINKGQVEYDCAVLDVRIPMLPGQAADAKLGNNIADLILNHHSLPCAILSGYSDESNVELMHVLKVSRDGIAQDKVMDWIYDRVDLFFSMKILRREQRARTNKALLEKMEHYRRQQM